MLLGTGIVVAAPAWATCGPVAGSGWVQQSPCTSPGARLGAASATDAKNQAVVVFGGCKQQGAPAATATIAPGGAEQEEPLNVDPWCGPNGSTSNLLDDTLVWNGSNWTRFSRPAGATDATWPHARWRAHMSFDKTSGRVLLFGGLFQDVNGSAPASAVSCWGDEVLLESDTPHPVGYDPQLVPETYTWHRYAITGVTATDGSSLGSWCFNDTWAWTGSTWTKLTSATQPTARFDGAMAGDWTCVPTSTIPCTGTAGRPTLFGGCTGIGLWGNHSEQDEPYYWGCANYAGVRGDSTMVEDRSTVDPDCTNPTTCDITHNGTTNPTVTERENSIGDTWVWAGSFGSNIGTWTQRCGFAAGAAPAGACAATSGAGSCVAREEDNSLSVCSPMQFIGPTMTYNPATKEMILAGGYNYDPHWKYTGWRVGGGVWAWDDDATYGCRDTNNLGRTGACWRLILSSGNHNVYASQTYAANCSKVPGDFFHGTSATVLHGGGYHALIFGGAGDLDGNMAAGTCAPAQYGPVALDQTWLWMDSGNPSTPESSAQCWDGGKKYSTNCWVQVAGASPSARLDGTLAFDAVRSRSVAQGGQDETATLGETWTYGDS